MFDRQLDVFGDEHDIAPAHERMRLFEPVRVMPGQLALGARVSSKFGVLIVTTARNRADKVGFTDAQGGELWIPAQYVAEDMTDGSMELLA